MPSAKRKAEEKQNPLIAPDLTMRNGNVWVAPTDEVFARMKSYRQAIRSVGGENETFAVGDICVVSGHTCRGIEYQSWFGLIHQIRANDPAEVCVKVIWLQNDFKWMKDSGGVDIPSEGSLGPELWASNLTQIILTDNIEGIIKVVFWKDDDGFARDINVHPNFLVDDLDDDELFDPGYEFFCRGRFDIPGLDDLGRPLPVVTAAPIERVTPPAHTPSSINGDAEGETTPRMRKRRRAMGWAKSKKKKATNAIRIRFKPFAQPTCFCGKMYDPLPLDDGPMVFCPGKPDASGPCGQWMHVACLRNSAKPLSQEFKDEMIRTGLGLVDERRAELENPITLDVRLRPVPSGTSTAAASKSDGTIVVPQTGQSARAGNKKPSLAVLASLLATIPQEIKQAAESHIMRGTTNTGIVGNMRKVLLARDIFRQAREGHADLVASEIESWQEHFGDDEEDAEGPKQESDPTDRDKQADNTAWMCPRCQGPI